MILTGTPINNVLFDIWAQLEWLSKGLSGFSTLPNFRAFHGKYEKRMEGGTAVAKLVGFKNTPLIQERLARLSFLFRKSEMKDKLPEKVNDIYEVAMTSKQAGIYKQIATKLVAEIDEIIANAEAKGTTNITVEHILTKLIRLAQVCSGFVKTDDEEDIANDIVIPGKILRIEKSNPKLDALVKMIKEDWENDPNSKCIVWATFIPDIEWISERLAAEGINHVGYHKTVQPKYRVKDAATAEDLMNFDDSCRVLVANPASAGIGQNYLGYDVEHPENSNMYVNHHIYYSCNWSAVDRIQSEDRSHRKGTRTNLRITDLMIPYTIDQEIRDRVTAKRDMAMSIQDIRSILANVLKGYRK
jgi:SNF2 family DNA or RNA helicase